MKGNSHVNPYKIRFFILQAHQFFWDDILLMNTFAQSGVYFVI